MQLKRVFPDSLTIEINIPAAVQDRLWEISRQCCRFWNAALQARIDDRLEQPDSTQATLNQLIEQDPTFAPMARTVLERVLWTLEEAFAQYHQAQQDYQAGRRPDSPAYPAEHAVTDFFPLYFAEQYLRYSSSDNRIDLRDGQDWIGLDLPHNDVHREGMGVGLKIDAVLLMYHGDSQRFKLEINPILEDIRD